MGRLERFSSMTVVIRKIILDVLKPREISLVNLSVDMSTALCKAGGVDEAEVIVREVDVMTETIKLTLMGPNIRYDEVTRVLKEQGMAIRGIDEITVARVRKSSM